MLKRHQEKKKTSDGKSKIILRRKTLFGSQGEEIELTSREETGRLKTGNQMTLYLCRGLLNEP